MLMSLMPPFTLKLFMPWLHSRSHSKIILLITNDQKLVLIQHEIGGLRMHTKKQRKHLKLH